MTLRPSKGWCGYVTETIPLSHIMYFDRTSKVWKCDKCHAALYVIGELDANGEAVEVGCPNCRWAINKEKQIRNL